MKKKLLWGTGAVLAVLMLLAGTLYYVLLHRVQGEYFDSDGVKIHYTDQGAGAPVILIHGYGANADLNWRLPGIHQRLEKQFRVIAMDVRGHGLSDKPHEAKYGLEVVHDVRRLMDHLNLPKAHVVGYSMGGFITMKFATMYPDRLLCAMPCGMAWMEPGSELTKLGQKIHKGQHNKPERFFLDLPALKFMVDAFSELAITEAEMRSINVPICAVKAEHEELVTGGRAFNGEIPNFKEVLLPRGLHGTVIFYRDFTDALEDFLLAHTPTEAMATAR